MLLTLALGVWPTSQALAQAPIDAEAARLLVTLRQAHPGTQFTEAARTDIPGVYEVWMQGNVAYVAATTPRYFLFGRLFDTQDMRDLTAPRIAQRAGDVPVAPEDAAPPIAFDRLPLADAITVRRGNGQRQVAVFSDPGCGYCRQLEAELATLDDVTIHTFLVPFQGEARPVAIWCAADRTQAWQQWMLHGDARAQRPSAGCDHPVARNLALARALRVQGTPTLFWADGSRTDGYVDRSELQARLVRASTGPVAGSTTTERRP
ncbi:DsbC family protein [Pseudorhodoferax sp. Leaf267]|uniref:DsbC family protein n=1 Tax=Pseudorhodoferax sp. Leaf267 TaxID=1736316 RepID=UPI000A5EBE39|nr:DsbC family protein [Pseudorhodoferax sp. Leaf267]